MNIAYLYDENDDSDLNLDQDDSESIQGCPHCCTQCMDCLGMYWSDFV